MSSLLEDMYKYKVPGTVLHTVYDYRIRYIVLQYSIQIDNFIPNEVKANPISWWPLLWILHFSSSPYLLPRQHPYHRCCT